MKKLTLLNVILIIVATASLIFAVTILCLFVSKDRSVAQLDNRIFNTADDSEEKEYIEERTLEKRLAETLSEIDGVISCRISIGDELAEDKKTVFVSIEATDKDKEKLKGNSQTIKKLALSSIADVTAENIYLQFISSPKEGV